MSFTCPRCRCPKHVHHYDPATRVLTIIDELDAVSCPRCNPQPPLCIDGREYRRRQRARKRRKRR